jgi:alpha-galactosidase
MKLVLSRYSDFIYEEERMYMDESMMRQPSRVFVETDSGWVNLSYNRANSWSHSDIFVSMEFEETKHVMNISLEAKATAIYNIRFHWKQRIDTPVTLLGDHWERAYGDLQWSRLEPERVFPWYVLMNDGKSTYGFGVKTGPAAMCHWQVDSHGITLCADVSCGNQGVQLGGRKLNVAELVDMHGDPDMSPFVAAQAFCKLMCDQPLMPSYPVYGGNNWYYAYGKSTHEKILKDSRFISELAGISDNRPFMVIDDCWQLGSGVSGNGGPWIGNRDFPDMKRLAEEMKAIGVRPGIWCRPLLTHEKVPDTWVRYTKEGHFLDPSMPEVLDYVAEFIGRMHDWGYQLIKHDFTTFDIFGQWGFEMGSKTNQLPHTFADRSRTSAEIITELYRTIAMASKDSIIIGCNTIGHLAAGLFEIQRTGDDTSGKSWERTRRMGVNTLAFRMPQHGTFFSHDADCVGITPDIPWSYNKQWLDVLANSGTPLFVSADATQLNSEQVEALREAFRIASKPIPVAEPLDWMFSTCPSSWKIAGEVKVYDWTKRSEIPLEDHDHHWWL